MKRRRKKSTFAVFSIFVSPFNGYIAGFLHDFWGVFLKQFDTNLMGFALSLSLSFLCVAGRGSPMFAGEGRRANFNVGAMNKIYSLCYLYVL
jgi:hypothetical protein